MKESFSKPFQKQEVEKEIESGISDYLRKKFYGIEGNEETVFYNIEQAERPITREEIETNINSFVEENFNTITSVVLNNDDRQELNNFKILNKDLRNFGFGNTSIIVEAVLGNNKDYFQTVNKREDGSTSSWSDVPYSDELIIPGISEFNYNLLNKNNIKVQYPDIGDNFNKFKDISEILATAYLKNEIRVDSKLNAGNYRSEYPQRYFHKEFGRYLCENDFGMKPFDQQSDVSDITPFAQSTQRQIRKILSNIETIKNITVGGENSDSPYFEDLRKNLEVEYQMPEWPRHGSPNYEEIREEINRLNLIIDGKIKQAKEEKLSDTLESEKIRSLILEAIPFAKFANEIGSRKNIQIESFIENDIGGETDLYKRLYYFKSQKFQEGIKALILRDTYTLPELGDKTIATSVAHNKPVILEEERIKELLDNSGNSYVEKTKREIINSEPDEQIKKISYAVSSGRGDGSPYSFHPFDFYQSLKKVGVDKFLELYPQAKQDIFEENRNYSNLNMNEFIDGIDGIYKIFGDKICQMEADKIKKEMWHESTLNSVGLWNYFGQRATGEKPPARNNEDYEMYQKLQKEYHSKISEFLNNLSQSERRKLFFEGKQTYWLAKQVQNKIWELDRNKNIQVQGEYREENEDNEFKFHRYHHNINWEQYDCKNIDLDKLSKYLGTHGNIICTLLANKNDNEQVGSNVNLETIMQVVEAMESGADMRGVALAFDKKKYLDGILSGKEQKNDLEYALKDWPVKLRSMISSEEFQIYFENAEQYLYQDPNGMIRYAELLQKEPRMRELLGEKIDKKSDLDLRLCLSVQTSEVRGWYFEGAEYVGHPALQRYFVRFQATREQSGGYPNLHDALYWIPNIKRVEAGEARSLLDDVDTVDESNELKNFLSRYEKEKDPLKTDGSIKSLRELKKRVFAIEADIDLSTLSPEILDIISAPGFNLSELKRLQKESRFTDLVEGKLDKNQPFVPHKRIFTVRPLNELLKEGLGSFKEKIRGTAQDPKGMFDNIRKLMKDKDINGKPMQIQDLLNEVPLDMEEDILKLLQDHKVATGALLEANVHKKSDPDGWVCGNYTDCCMPFGDYKNTDYMFNEGTQYFTIKYNGRIVSQSVVVDSLDKRNKEDVVILDNIEVANNYKNHSALLSRVYKTFWAEYTSKKVKIGTGYSDLIPDGARLESNNYFPKHSLSYSDATGSQIYDLPKIRGVESLDKILTFANLTERDAEIIAEMEKIAYPDGMAQGKGEVLDVIRKSRELELPGAASSFILRKGTEPAGYLLVLPEESKMNEGENVAHIYDMVVLPKFQGGIVARKMMERMLDVSNAYDVPAIEFEARESTSYRLVTNPRIAKWIEGKGYKLTYNELLPEYLNGEDFYYVRLDKIKVQE